MNKLIKILSIFAIISATTACSSDSKDLLSYNIQVKGEQSASFDNANIKVNLYGVGAMVADNTATLISQSILPIKNMPSTIKLQWPENAHLLISNPPVRKKEEAVYYLNITIDTNNDGLLCKGDYRQDYNRTSFVTMDDMPTKLLTYYMVDIDSEPCQKF